MTRLKGLVGLGLALGLSACSAIPSAAPPTAHAPATTRPGGQSQLRGVVGMDAKHLFAMFGTPRLDIRERTVRKLQFANGRCVLDAYLYTSERHKEPVVTHVDARLPNGDDTDPATCAAALQQR